MGESSMFKLSDKEAVNTLHNYPWSKTRDLTNVESVNPL